jgi:hypothetical protein
VSGLSLSMLFHGLLLLVIISPWFRRYHVFSANGSDAPGFGGGGGAGEQYIALPALRPETQTATTPVVKPVETPVVPPPVITPTEIPPPTPAPDSVPQPQTQSSPDQAGAAGSQTGGAGGGSGGGNNGGNGPGTGSGAGAGPGGSLRGTPPRDRRFVSPPLDGIPRELRGAVLTVQWFVDADGRVDRIETTPPLGNSAYSRRFEEAMLAWVFVPGRDSIGRAVPSIYSTTITLSH